MTLLKVQLIPNLVFAPSQTCNTKGGSKLVSFPDPQAKRREGLGDSPTSTRSGGIHGMQLYYTS